MPYIKKEERPELDQHLDKLLEVISNKGEGHLNYCITKLCDGYVCSYGSERYAYYNEVTGVLVCALLEFYRRKTAPYENIKKDENGDVYRFLTNENV